MKYFTIILILFCLFCCKNNTEKLNQKNKTPIIQEENETENDNLPKITQKDIDELKNQINNELIKNEINIEINIINKKNDWEDQNYEEIENQKLKSNPFITKDDKGITIENNNHIIKYDNNLSDDPRTYVKYGLYDVFNTENIIVLHCGGYEWEWLKVVNLNTNKNIDYQLNYLFKVKEGIFVGFFAGSEITESNMIVYEIKNEILVEKSKIELTECIDQVNFDSEEITILPTWID